MKLLLSWAAVSLLLAGSSEAASSGGVAFWSMDAMHRVGRSDLPADDDAPHVEAARGEWESFQVIATGSPTALVGAQVTAGGAESLGSGKALPVPVVLREEYVRVTTSTPRSPLPPGDYADALVPQSFPAGPLPSDERVNVPFWVDVFVPYGSEPGEYRGTVELRLVRGEVLAMEYRVTVWGVDLPVVPSLRTSIALSWRRVAELHGFDRDADYPTENLQALLNAYTDLLAQHRLSVNELRGTYPDAKTGILDVEKAEKELRRHLLHQHASTISLPLGPDWPFADPLGRDRRAAQRYAAEWMKLLDRFRCAGRGYVIMMNLDEPNDAEAYGVVREWGAFFNEVEKQYGVRMPLLVTEQPTPDDPSWGKLDGAADIWVPHFSSVYEDMEASSGRRDIARRIAAGDEVWAYAALVQMSEAWEATNQRPKILKEAHPPVWCTDYPPMNFRIVPWLLMRHGITGLAYWDVVHFERGNDPWLDAGSFRGVDGSTFNGDGFFIYPATKYRQGANQPVASIRLKWLRDSMEDYDYLTLLADAKGRAAALAVSAGFADGFGSWSDNPTALYAARREIATLLSEPKEQILPAVRTETPKPSQAP